MSEEKKKFTQDDVGKVITITTETGTYYEERIVQVFCDVCAASFIGIMREAGGFLAGHDCYHKWEHSRGASAAQGFTP
mgnify:FL=1|tara:strand:+ start:3746 stop:3979 length:234 start_codon:yes stop_codon:yes gene_type:complete